MPGEVGLWVVLRRVLQSREARFASSTTISSILLLLRRRGISSNSLLQQGSLLKEGGQDLLKRLAASRSSNFGPILSNYGPAWSLTGTSRGNNDIKRLRNERNTPKQEIARAHLILVLVESVDALVGPDRPQLHRAVRTWDRQHEPAISRPFLHNPEI